MGLATTALNLLRNVLAFVFGVRGALPLVNGAYRLFTSFGSSHGTGEERERNITKALGGAASLLLGGAVVALIRDPNIGSGNPLTDVIEALRWFAESGCAITAFFGMNTFLTVAESGGTGDEREKGMQQAVLGAAGMVVIAALVQFIPTTI